MTGTCIFCLEESDLTDEHVIPESMGGHMVIHAVCGECNSTIGSEIDAKYADSLPVVLQRYIHEIPGKSGEVPFPFKGTGSYESGLKVRLGENFKPFILPSVTSRHEGDQTRIGMVFDSSDEAAISTAVAKKAERVVRQCNPQLSDEDVSRRVEEIVASADRKVEQVGESIGFSFSIKVERMTLEVAKIAYELAFDVFGYEYVRSSETGRSLRDAVVALSADGIRGKFLVDHDPLQAFFPESGTHTALVLGGSVILRLFDMVSIVLIEESDGRFMVDDDDAVAYSFDYKTGGYIRETIGERISRLGLGF